MKFAFIRVHSWFKICLFLTCFGAMAADPISDALQKGLFEEEANYNLDAAIKAYQSVIDQTAEQRKLAATAVFRLGECYRKLQNTNDAVAHYQLLVRDYQDQTNLVELSRQNLTQLGAKEATSTVKAGFSPRDQEESEMERYEKMANESPDLLNAKIGGGDAPLHRAAKAGHAKLARFLLTNKAEVNLPNNNGILPLHYAVYYQHNSVVELLLEHGADVNAVGNMSTLSGQLAHCQPLHLAAYNGNQAIAELLLAHKAEVNGRDSRRRTPLHDAVNRGFLGMTRFLISHGAEVNAVDYEGSNPAMLAATVGYENVLRLLLESGTDVNTQDRAGNTLAHLGASQRSPGLLQAVLDRKPNLEVQNTRAWTPLIGALVNRNQRAVEMLLKAGADPNGSTETDAFPLLAAVDFLNKDAVRALLAHKADPAKDSAGITALARARSIAEDDRRGPPDKKVAKEIADLLRQHGAKDLTAAVPYIAFARDGKELNAKSRQQDPRGLNYYTLYEYLAYSYNGRGPKEGQDIYGAPEFPDFSDIRIQRGSQKLRMNLENALLTGDCSKDMRLAWGDTVDIPTKDHKLNERWTELPTAVAATLSKCLEREVTVTIKGETTVLKLRPVIWERRGGGTLKLPEGEPAGAVPFLRLGTVLENSGLLRASSDRTRVKVIRKMASGESREFVFNLEAPMTGEDLILREGDVIEVPEKQFTEATENTQQLRFPGR